MDVVRYAHHAYSVLTCLSLLPIPTISLSLSLPLYHSDGPKDEDGNTALSIASYKGWMDVVRELVAADGSVEHIRMQNNNGKTGLGNACTGGWTDVVRELIAADGSVEHLQMQDRWGRTALDYAQNDEIKALLRAAGAQEAQTQ